MGYKGEYLPKKKETELERLIMEQSALISLVEAYRNGNVINATKQSSEESIRNALKEIEELSERIRNYGKRNLKAV